MKLFQISKVTTNFLSSVLLNGESIWKQNMFENYEHQNFKNAARKILK